MAASNRHQIGLVEATLPTRPAASACHRWGYDATLEKASKFVVPDAEQWTDFIKRVRRGMHQHGGA